MTMTYLQIHHIVNDHLEIRWVGRIPTPRTSHDWIVPSSERRGEFVHSINGRLVVVVSIKNKEC